MQHLRLVNSIGHIVRHRTTSSMAEPSVTLNTGAKMPLMAFGTLMESLDPDHNRVVKIIEDVIDVGYRHFDCATLYNTEQMVGEALANKIKTGVIKREDVFITTKLWRNSYGKDEVVPALKTSLQKLGVDYVDLYLIHWPTGFKSGTELLPRDESGNLVYGYVDHLDTWKGMEKCANLGLTKAIGLSNFNSKQLQRILDNCKIAPANMQIESHPYLTNNKLIEMCNENNITVMAYAALAGFNQSFSEEKGMVPLFQNKTLLAIAEKHKRTAGQIALRFQLQRNVGVAPKSAKRSRMEENFKAIEFQLDEEDMKAIYDLNTNFRLNHEFPDHKDYPFHEEF